MLFLLTMSILSSVRRPIWFRILISTWALWFAAALSDVGPLGSCPKHGSHGVLAHVDGAAHAGHGAHVDGASTRPDSHRDDGPRKSHAACTCIGLCCCAGSIAAPNAAALTIAVVVRRAAVPSAPAASVVTRAPYAHPFANGPPPSLLV
jgi:hypothetical protein